jgi:hypothetical protein
LGSHADRWGGKRKRSFLKKRTKKLLNPGPRLSGKTEAKFAKVFCFFFFKKEVLACFLSGGLRAPRAPLGRGRRRSIGQRAQQGKTRDE